MKTLEDTAFGLGAKVSAAKRTKSQPACSLKVLWVCAGFKGGWNAPQGSPACVIWHLDQLLPVPAFACMCLDNSELFTLTAHAAVDTTCEDTCAAGELASGFGVKTDAIHDLYACVPQADVSAGNRWAIL